MAEETPDPKTSDQPAAKADDGPVARVIEAFGGIRPMANKLSVPVSTVQGWKERDSIPATRHAQILQAAQSHHITLDEVLLQSSAGPGESPGGLPVLEIGPAPSNEEKAAAKQDAPRRSAGPIPASGGSKTPAVRPAKAGGGMTIGLLLGAVAVVAGVVLAILARDLWQPLLSPAQPAGTAVAGALEGQVSGLEQQLAAQAARLEELGAQIGTLPTGGGEAVGDLGQKLTALESELGALRQDLARFEQRPAVPALVNDRFASLSGDAAQLGERAAALEARLSDLDRLDLIVESLIQRAGPGPANDEVALMLALIQLRETVATGAPYAAAFDLVSATIGEDADLRGHLPALADYADSGVPTVVRLAQGFPGVARSMVAAGAGGDEGLVSDVLRSLSDVVTVRPVGEVAGDDAGAIVARAEIHLQSGDLAGALAELDLLPDAAQNAALGWLVEARARRDADAALAALGAAVIRRLAGS